MRRVLRVSLLLLVSSAFTGLRADCEQCETAGLSSCQTSGNSVICVYENGTYTHHIRQKSPE